MKNRQKLYLVLFLIFVITVLLVSIHQIHHTDSDTNSPVAAVLQKSEEKTSPSGEKQLNTLLLEAVREYDSNYPVDVVFPGNLLLWPSRFSCGSDCYSIISRDFSFSRVKYNYDSHQYEIEFDVYTDDIISWFRQNILDDDRIVLVKSLYASTKEPSGLAQEAKRRFIDAVQDYALAHPGQVTCTGRNQFRIRRPLGEGGDLINICSINSSATHCGIKLHRLFFFSHYKITIYIIKH